MIPAAADAQTPDADTLVRRMRERAAASVAGARSYKVAYVAGGVRMVSHAELAPKDGRWVQRLGPGAFELPVRGMIANALQMMELATTASKVPATFGAVRPDTAAGRTVYATRILPRSGFGESEMESLTAMVDAGTYDVIRFVTTTRRGGRGDGLITIWTDLLEYRDSAGIRLASRYRVRVWNIPEVSGEEARAETRRDLAARRAEAATLSGAARTELEWNIGVLARLLETGILDIPVSVQLLAVNQPPPPEIEAAAEDDGR